MPRLIAFSLALAALSIVCGGQPALASDWTTFGFDVAPVTPASARRIAQAYGTWGKGIHPASLNFGDCFAYEVAKEHGCRLLYVGDDFARTDIEGVL